VPRWCNADYDALAAELAQTADINARAEIVKQMNDMLMQDYAIIPLIHRGSVSAWANTLLGVRHNAWDSEVWNIADWSRSSN
jgi:peptide/nickel transport system substrate-binding protein